MIFLPIVQGCYWKGTKSVCEESLRGEVPGTLWM